MDSSDTVMASAHEDDAKPLQSFVMKRAATPEVAASGFTFTVEPDITPGGVYASRRDRYCEPGTPSTLTEAWTKTMPGCSIDAMSPAPPGTVEVFTKQNLFAKAVHAAFYDHHPLILSPDIIWLTIAQGLANHVDQNAEALRHKFVGHEGQKEIIVSRPEFVKGSPRNDWEGVFPEFASKIAENIAPGTTELIEADFSTTGAAEKIASYITLMDTVQHYFTYTMCCGCGFPEITLTGTPADWESVRRKAENLRKYDLDFWLDGLLPALDHFVAASHGSPDLDFWRSLCNINTGTSFPNYTPLTGWVQVFFPYLIEPGRDEGFGRPADVAAAGAPKKAMRRNDAIANYAESIAHKVNLSNFEASKPKPVGNMRASFQPPIGTLRGVKLEHFPPGVASAPFVYKDVSTRKTHKMAFMAGVTCLVQHGSGAIEPKVGWAVLDSGHEVCAEPAA